MENNAKAVIVRWIEDRTQEYDAPALTWLMQRAAFGLMQCYPSATHAANTEMIVRHIETVLGRGPS